MACIYHYSIIQDSFAVLKVPCDFTYSSLPSLKLLATIGLFTVFLVLPFPECCIVGVLKYGAFTNWLLTLSDLPLYCSQAQMAVVH